MKSYQQYCGLARGLDVVGDRWTLLIIRELALGHRRYGQLHADLTGIPTNLLVDRLRALTADGLVEPAGSGSAPGGYSLTERGRELLPVLHALVRWATPTMLGGPDPDDLQNIRWLAFAAIAYLPAAPPELSVSLRLTSDGEHVMVEADAGTITVDIDDSPPTDVIVEANIWALMGLVSGALPLDRLTLADPAATVMGSTAARRRVTTLLAHNG